MTDPARSRRASLALLRTTAEIGFELTGAVPLVGGAGMTGLFAAGVHTLAMFAVMAVCAVVVYAFVGVVIAVISNSPGKRNP